MATLWFCLVAVMLAVYVLLDGFDLGAGIVHLGVARTDQERRAVIGTIGPVWDGNEVWLIAGGGTLFFAFPLLYASSFSGFYLPLTMVLWLLILRGISIEFRSHVKGLLWSPFWDFVFCLSSALLAIFYGAALGNVVRGVPLDSSGYFFEALWTNFRFGSDAGILDWYTILVGLAAYFALAEHGALWVAHKTDGAIRQRAQRIARMGWWVLTLLTVGGDAGYVPRAAHGARAHAGAAMGPNFPGAGNFGPDRHFCVSAWRNHAKTRAEGFRFFLRLLAGNAHECGVWTLSLRAAGARRIGTLPFHLQHAHCGPRNADRPGLVDRWHDFGDELLRVSLPALCG